MRHPIVATPEERILTKGENVNQRTHKLLQTFLALVVVTGFCPLADAAPKALWQIGKFDQSSGEFNPGKVHPPVFATSHPKCDVLYIVGKSVPATDWPAFQPGSANGRAEFRPHPYTIQFDLADVPRGVYTLKVALLVESPRVARLQVEINGHRALFFQHPTLNYAGGDTTDVFLPSYSADTITVDLPTNFLRQGTNELVLTAIDKPAERDDATNPGLYYDALELDQDPDRKFSPGYCPGPADHFLPAERRQAIGTGGHLHSSQRPFGRRASGVEGGQGETH